MYVVYRIEKIFDFESVSYVYKIATAIFTKVLNILLIHCKFRLVYNF